MKRRHFFEFHERSECPAFIRDSVVETLGHGLRWGGLANVIGPAFQEFLRLAQPTRILDLCSGSGQPAANLVKWLKENNTPCPQFILSDLFPNRATLEDSLLVDPDRLVFEAEPVDATNVDSSIGHDARMMVNAFHHFDTKMAKSILEDCALKKKSIFIFEGVPRGLLAFLTLALSMPVVPLALFVNPFLAPRHKLLKFVFTFFIPLIPLVFIWDSVVSNLRTYTESEWLEMTRSIGGYQWIYRKFRFGRGAHAVVCFGIPESS